MSIRAGPSPTFCQVWGVPRGMKANEPAGPPGLHLVGQLETHLAVEHVHRLVLIRVCVHRRSVAGRNDGLEREQSALRLLAARLEHHVCAQRGVDRLALTRSLEHRLCHAASS